MRPGSLRISEATFWSSTTISIFFSKGNSASRRRRSRFRRKTISADLFFTAVPLEFLELLRQSVFIEDSVENDPIEGRPFQEPDDPLPVF